MPTQILREYVLGCIDKILIGAFPGIKPCVGMIGDADNIKNRNVFGQK
jgi:hypothetical protein